MQPHHSCYTIWLEIPACVWVACQSSGKSTQTSVGKNQTPNSCRHLRYPVCKQCDTISKTIQNARPLVVMSCEDMERYLVVCYAALSANTKCKAGVLSVLSCVASNARLKRALWNRCPEARHVKAKEAASRTPNVFQPGKVVNGSVWWHQTHTGGEERKVHHGPPRLLLSRNVWMHWLQHFKSRMPAWFACKSARQSRCKWYRAPVRLTNREVDVTSCS